MKEPRPIGNPTECYESRGLCKMAWVCLVAMQKFDVNVMCPGYDARKYERRAEKREIEGRKREILYTT